MPAAMDGTDFRRRRFATWAKFVVAGLVVAWLVGTAWHDTMADPIVRRTSVVLSRMPANAAPVTVVLLSDIHVAEPNMPPSRVARIVEQVNALRPDLIVLAGDFLSDPGFGIRPYSADVAIAPLAKLRAPLGVYAVIGNHDHWGKDGGVRRELARRGIILLANQARRAGPLALGGLDDEFVKRHRVTRILAEMKGLGGGLVLLSHSPDEFALLPRNSGLQLAGHTHCGQVSFFGWAPITNSRYGQRFACGLVSERGNVLVVTAGLGTSVVPFRFGAVPDIWLVRVRPR